MNNSPRWLRILTRTMSYVLVAALASAATLMIFTGGGSAKLLQLEQIISTCFVGDVDRKAVADAAGNAMVDALGDRWSYYMTAEQYSDYENRKANVYVGIGVTITVREDGQGLDILKVEQGGAAQEAGILPGDILTEVEGQAVADLGLEGAKNLIQGEAGTKVNVTILRDGEAIPFTLKRKRISIPVAAGTLLADNIGLVTIENFNEKSAEESIEVIEDLLSQGATSLIFDVRNNPGGFQKELVDLLDYLLPEGDLFRTVEFNGWESTDKSDADCLKMPMAVMVNADSYSAAEFFAAALEEYDWAIVVGEQTCGKAYYQRVSKLLDGSAVNLSMGKYYTPNGVNLTEAGGLTPEVLVPVDQETAALIASGTLAPEEDPQIQAAVKALLETE